MAEATLRRAVFLDRDGTLNVDTGYVRCPDDVRLIENAAEGARALAAAGYALVIVSNQSGIARGIMTPQQADAVDAKLLALLRERGVNIEATYRCPHLPGGKLKDYDVECDCRKPKPGMILKAARDHGLDLAASWTVGDGPRDVEAGIAAGTHAILISPDGTAAGVDERGLRAKDMVEAARIIVSSP